MRTVEERAFAPFALTLMPALLTIACSGATSDLGEDASPPEADAPGAGDIVICDLASEATSTPTLVWRFVRIRESPDQLVRVELGLPFLVVMADCSYYVLSNSAPNEYQTMRTGFMDLDESRELSRDLNVAGWSNAGYSGEAADGGIAEFSLPGVLMGCINACIGGNVPAWVEQSHEAAKGWARRLWREGSPLDGPVRAAVWRVDPGFEDLPLAAWPLAEPIDDHARSYDDLEAGDYPIVEQPGADDLRAITQRYINEEHGDWWWDFVPFGTEGTAKATGKPVYGMNVRDVVPFENEEGRLVLPLPDGAPP